MCTGCFVASLRENLNRDLIVDVFSMYIWPVTCESWLWKGFRQQNTHHSKDQITNGWNDSLYAGRSIRIVVYQTWTHQLHHIYQSQQNRNLLKHTMCTICARFDRELTAAISLRIGLSGYLFAHVFMHPIYWRLW